MAVPQPNIIWIGTKGRNVTYMPGMVKQALVLHIMSGTLEGCDSWFSNSAAQASTHYGIGKDGEIHEYVDPMGDYMQWSNGIVNRPWQTVIDLMAQNPGDNPNAWSVAAEFEGYAGDVYTDAQIAAGTQLFAWLIEQLGIAADESHLLGHNEFDSVNRPQCPGQPGHIWLAFEQGIADWLQREAYGLTPGAYPGPV